MITETLGELCEIQIGRTPSRSESRYWGKGHKWVSISDMNSRVITETREQITDAAIDEIRCRKVSAGTLLFSFKLTIGKMAFAGTDLFTNEAIAALNVRDPKKLSAEFLFYALKVANYGVSNQAAKGKTLNSRSLAAIEIPLPPLEDQKRIAYLLSKVEGLIAQRKEHLQQLDDLLKSVFHGMFGDPVKNERGWDVKPLSEIAFIRRGKFTPRPRNDPKYFGGMHPFIQTGDIAKANGRLQEYSQTLNDLGVTVSRRFEIGTIVIAIVGATIGETAILEFATYATDSVIGINLKKPSFDTEAVFLEFVMRRWKPILRAKAPEAARANINIDTLSPILIIAPPESLCKSFCAISERIESLSEQYGQSLSSLFALQGALSQRAFNGELELSRIDVPEGYDLSSEGQTNQQTNFVAFELSTPPKEADFKSSKTRKNTLRNWLTAYAEHLGKSPMEADSFIALVQQKLSDLESKSDIGWYSHEIGVAEYDEIKKWIFDELDAKRLHQNYDDATNRVHVIAAKE